MIKAFYTAGILMDILEQFGQQSEDFISKKKYAKWKAAYIHNCLKSGDKPTSGGPDDHLKNVIDITKGEDEPMSLLISPRAYRDYPNGDGYYPTGPAPASSPVTPGVQPEPKPETSTSQPEPKPEIYTPQPERPKPSVSTASEAGFVPDPDMIQKAQKYCKYATSALNYDDVKTAIDNLNKALNLLQLGKE